MSSDRQGFIANVPGDKLDIELDDLDELQSRHQELLSKLHNKSTGVRCMCGEDSDAHRYLHVFRWPQSNKLGLRRANAAEHPPSCLFARLDDGQRTDSPYGFGIFEKEQPQTAALATLIAGMRYDYSEAEHYTFSRFCSRSLSRAQMLAWQTANPSPCRDGLRQPTAFQQLTALDQEFRQPHFPGHLSAYAAADRTGCSLFFGLVARSPDLTASAGLLGIDLWSFGSFDSALLLVPACVWSRGLGDALAFGHVTPPPYLAIGVGEPDGVVRKLRLYPVFADGIHLVPVESGYERAFAQFLLQQQIVFIKPVLRHDAEQLLRDFHIDSPQFIPFRNDYWCVKMTSAGRPRFFVTELRGLKNGENSPYDLNLGRKKAVVESWGSDFFYKEPLGWNYEYRPVDFTTWQGIANGWAGPWPAVTAWLSRQRHQQ